MKLSNLSGQLGKFLDMPDVLPPVESWNPPLSGDIDMRICSNGAWLHEGDEIKREKLVRLFSTILKREDNDYFLVTPVEKWRISVEDQPFVVVLMEVINQGNSNQIIRMITNTGDEIELNHQNPMITDDHEAPKVLIRGNMHARLSRNVFYQLAEMAFEKDGCFWVLSGGCEFAISNESG